MNDFYKDGTEMYRRGINDAERAYLNYQPKYGFVPKILSVINPENIYKIPPAIQKLTEYLPSDLLDDLSALLQDLSVLQRRMEQCLKDDNSSGVSFKEYKKEKRSATPDYQKIDEFEKFHQSDIKGRTQAEVYPLILDMQDELTEYRDFLNKQFFNGTADYEHTETVKNKDKNAVEKAIEKDMKGELASEEYTALEVKAQLSRYAFSRINNAKSFIKDLNGVLCYTTNTYYNGNVRDVVDKLSTAPNKVLNSLNLINNVQFNKAVNENDQDRRRNARLNSKEIKKGMNELMQTIATAKTDSSNDILSWARTIDTDYDQSPLTQLVADALDKVEFIDEEYDKTMMELYKHTKLDKMLKEDQIRTLTQKKAARQVSNLISEIVKEKNNNTFDLDKFLLDNKLENPGTLCTP